MKIILQTILLMGSISAYAENGIVKVETTYQDLSISNSSVKYTGRGFVVDYPIESSLTKKTSNLKVVLTAAHLVFGGIADERQDNYKIFISDTNEEIFSLGMISDVIHDTAAVILCTEEAIQFFSDEFKAKGIELSDLVNLDGQLFTKGGGCVSKGEAKVSKDITAYAKYNGNPIVLNSENNSGFLLSDKSINGAKLVVNKDSAINYLTSEKTYAVPWIPGEKPKNENVTSGFDLEKYLNAIDKDTALSLSNIAGEYSVPFSLESGYSGSPIVSFDQNLNKIVVNGIYKSTTQTSADDKYGNLGWISPIELSSGLINILTNRYAQNLHRWNTVPQAYLSLVNNNLVRSMAFSQFFLYEEAETEQSPLTPEGNDTKSIQGWVRSDTGNQMWLRTDTGAAVSNYPQKSKQLTRIISDGTTEYSDKVSSIIMVNEAEEFIVLPPVMNSVLHVSKFNCESCVNSTYGTGYDIIWTSQEDSGQTGGAIWMSLNPGDKEVVTKTYTNSSKTENDQSLKINYTMQEDRIKIDLEWSSGSITFYILLNNNIYFQNLNGDWEEVSFKSVLETKTKDGKPALLETAGVIYYNTELPNPSSFRLKLMNQNTILFEQKSGE